MSKKRDIGKEILDGVRELKSGKTSRVVNVPAVSDIREKTGLSQSRFAALLGVSVRTLQDWEQGRRAPSRREVRDHTSKEHRLDRVQASQSKAPGASAVVADDGVARAIDC